MNPVFEEKENFTRFHLEKLLYAATGGEVARAGYFIRGADEFVEVVFHNGFHKRVNVSCDSLTALARDVLAAL